MMKIKKFHKALLALLMAGLFIVSAGQVNAQRSWEGPTQKPPGGNIFTPLTPNRIGQSKQGGLQLDASGGATTNGLIVVSGATLGCQKPLCGRVFIGGFDPQNFKDILNIFGDLFIWGIIKPEKDSGSPDSLLERLPVNRMAWMPQYEWLTLMSQPALKQLGVIAGVKWNDANNNGIWDFGESPMDGRTIILMKDGQEKSRVTTGGPTKLLPEGYYEFPNLSDGTYLICEQSQAEWQETFPLSGAACNTGNQQSPFGHLVTVTSSSNIFSINFGNYSATQTYTPRSRQGGGGCGDGKLNPGEECDPVGSWCFTGKTGVISICNSLCKCIPPPPQIGPPINWPAPPIIGGGGNQLSCKTGRQPGQSLCSAYNIDCDPNEECQPTAGAPGGCLCRPKAEPPPNKKCRITGGPYTGGGPQYACGGECPPNETCQYVGEPGQQGCECKPKTGGGAGSQSAKQSKPASASLIDVFKKSLDTGFIGRSFAQTGGGGPSQCDAIKTPAPCPSSWNEYGGKDQSLTCAAVGPQTVAWLRTCYKPR